MRYNGTTQKIAGLTNGQHYLFSIYSQAWGNATDGRSADLSVLTPPPLLLSINNNTVHLHWDGLLVTCLYQATGTEAEFTIVPQNDSTWHLYGFSNRVAPAPYNNPSDWQSKNASLPTHDVCRIYPWNPMIFVWTTNSAGTSWTSTSGTFKTLDSSCSGGLSKRRNPATFTSTGATLIGKLNSFDGSDAPTVTVYYGLIDQNQTDTGWDGSAVVGTVQAGADFSKAVTGLTAGQKVLLSCQGSQCCG